MQHTVTKLQKNEFRALFRINRKEIAETVTMYLLDNDDGCEAPGESLEDEVQEERRVRHLVDERMTDDFCIEFTRQRFGEYLLLSEIGADDGSYDEGICDLIAHLWDDYNQSKEPQ